MGESRQQAKELLEWTEAPVLRPSPRKQALRPADTYMRIVIWPECLTSVLFKGPATHWAIAWHGQRSCFGVLTKHRLTARARYRACEGAQKILYEGRKEKSGSGAGLVRSAAALLRKRPATHARLAFALCIDQASLGCRALRKRPATHARFAISSLY